MPTTAQYLLRAQYQSYLSNPTPYSKMLLTHTIFALNTHGASEFIRKETLESIISKELYSPAQITDIHEWCKAHTSALMAQTQGFVTGPAPPMPAIEQVHASHSQPAQQAVTSFTPMDDESSVGLDPDYFTQQSNRFLEPLETDKPAQHTAMSTQKSGNAKPILPPEIFVNEAPLAQSPLFFEAKELTAIDDLDELLSILLESNRQSFTEQFDAETAAQTPQSPLAPNAYDYFLRP